MLPKKNYYLNDYFDMFNTPYSKEKEYMKTDIYEINDKYILELDLPGLKKENIKVNYENGYLTITVEKNTFPVQPNTYIRRERFYGQMKRAFYIGIKKEEDLKAKYTDGVLTVSFPKQDAKGKEIKNVNIG